MNIILLQSTVDPSGITKPLYDVNPLLGVIATMFIFAIGYLAYKLNQREKQLEELNKAVRDLATSNTEAISNLSHLAEKLIGSMDGLTKDVKQQLEFSLSRIMDYLSATVEKTKGFQNGK